MEEGKVAERKGPHAKSGQVCAVIVTYHAGAQIFDCVQSVIDQVDEVVIVDNGSGNHTLAALHELEAQSRVNVIYNSANLGIARGLNRGIEYALRRGYRWVLTLDHDSEATPGMVAKLVRAFSGLDNAAGIVAANPFDRNGLIFLGENSPTPDHEDIIEVKFSISSGCLIDVRVFETIGLFNEQLFTYYVDTDLLMRVRRSGLKAYLCPNAVLLHSEGLKQRRRLLWLRPLYDAYGKEARYYLTRNAIYMFRSYYDDPKFCYKVARRLLKDSVKVLFFDRERRVKLPFIIKGLWDGLRGRYGALDSSGSRSES